MAANKKQRKSARTGPRKRAPRTRPVEVDDVEVPPFPLEPRCHLCNLWAEDKALFSRVTQALIDGRPDYPTIMGWLGWPVTQNSYGKLSGHNAKHVQPWILRVQCHREELRALKDALEEGEADPAVLLSWRLWRMASRLVDSLDAEQLGKLNFGDRLEFIFQSITSMSRSQRSEALNRLDKQRLKFEVLKYLQGKDAIEEVIVQALTEGGCSDATLDRVRRELAGGKARGQKAALPAA